MEQTSQADTKAIDTKVTDTEVTDVEAIGTEVISAEVISTEVSLLSILNADYSKAELKGLSPISLAYVGDAVFELYVRSRLLFPAKRIRDYHQQVVAQVKAEQQSDYVEQLMSHLRPEEIDILRRGRNATQGRNRRAEARVYQRATGFEALIGFLYLSDCERLFSLLALLAIE